MTRRVIFPDPDIWTKPKEHTVNVNPASAGDLRRAGAFIKHYLYRNGEGVDAILTETLEVGRAGQLAEALLATLDAVSQQLLTEVGLRALDEGVATIADPTFDPDDVIPEEQHRAARLITAHGRDERDEMNRIITETADVTPTLLALVDVYGIVMPGLSTNMGMQVVNNGIRKLSGMEAEGGQ